MGKIKSKLVKKTSGTLIREGIKFEENFEKNKQVLKDIAPSKKIRNQIAGYAARLKKQEKLEKDKKMIT
ncbi:30S ribosomal protein S17e [Candidatus Pacearchaeota archaeon]|jgi:ribosomal protein S17E|nr:30S ribosomal protein S17e [Candidatus Pacearchaeota archaeon]|tara:strand:+ start:1548 stop:1754 length:207 start_codon:yes stop_codon:yes gene_type:complete